MSDITITIKAEGGAFGYTSESVTAEIARILHALADTITADGGIDSAKPLLNCFGSDAGGITVSD
jgi:hypothetical protein